MTAKKQIDRGALEKCLLTEKFHGLSNELAKWRMNPDLSLMEKRRDKGRVLGFVKGLRFSARITYLIRGILTGKDLDVSWGHLIDEKGASCSPECDIIVHNPGCIEKWNNGDKDPIMDFKFIKCTEAIAVISCKSLTRSVDQAYCDTLSPYKIGNIYLFTECCSPAAVSRLRKQAKAAGYAGFYHLYAMKKGAPTFSVDEEGILEFIDRMKSLATSRRK